MTFLDAIRQRYGQATTDALPHRDQEFLRDCADMDADRLERYDLFETYAAGDQTTPLTDRQATYLEASGLPYVENICKPVLAAQTNRLRVTGFGVDGNDTATDWLNEQWWARNRMDVKQRAVHKGTAKLGDGFVFAEPDVEKGMVVLRRQRSCQVKPLYGEDCDELEGLVKVWSTKRKHPILNPSGEAILRMNLYYPDRIEKYMAASNDGTSANWSIWYDEDDEQPVSQVDDEGYEVADEEGDPLPVYGEDGLPVMQIVWPTPWTMDGTPEGEPIGLLGVHFREDPGDHTYGRSVLRPVVPLQCLLTKQAGDLANVLDHAFPVNYLTGDNSDTTALTLSAGEWMKHPSENAKFGQLPAADPGPVMESIEGTMRRVSVVSATPVHALVPSGQLPSGESLKTAEGPLTSANEDRCAGHTTPWEALARVSARIAVAFGLEAAPVIEPDQTVTVLWDPVETRNDESETTVLATRVRDLGLSQETALRELGYDPDEEKKKRAAEQKATLAAAQAAFDHGTDPRLRPGQKAPDEENPADRKDGQK